ncbi:methyltransferase domain-containing protein [Microlunatus ginsengisoli]|uniref:Methyltransferase domain-containing protein n=1 Tax=Microlunatus ginsengisoli TaxID=363863 RepID=A0ABP6ZUJ2_9ACTN
MSRETYTHGHAAPVLRSHSWRTAANSAGYLLPRLDPADRLLDVGAGPGTISIDLAGRLESGFVEAVDSAPAAIAAGTRAAAESGLDRIRFSVGDVYALDFADDSFDVSHAHQVLQHLADPVAALREMRRVTRPGGLVAVRDADYASMTWFPDAPGLDRWQSIYRQVAKAMGGEPDAGRRLKEWVLQAGFTELTCSASVWCFADADDLAWWSETWAERITGSDLAEHARDLGVPAAELDELGRVWRSWAGRPGAWFAVLHGEVLAVA